MRARELLVPVTIFFEDDASVKELDEAIHHAMGEVHDSLWQQCVNVIERIAVEQSGHSLKRKSSETKQLRGLSGNAEFVRGRFYYEDGREPGTVMVFDSRVGLETYQRYTPGAQQMYAQLAALAPSYKCASQIADLLTGDAPSSNWIWQRAQDEGGRLRERDKQERTATFEHGELLNADRPSKDFVGIEADSTLIHAWKQKGENHYLHMGIAYDGKEKAGKKRYRLTNKVITCGLYSMAEFGKDLFVLAQKYHNITDAKAILFSSDGERSLETVRQVHFSRAEHQLDWWHVGDKVREAYTWQRGDHIKRINKLIFSGDRDGFMKQLSIDRRRLKERRSKLCELEDYILPRWDMLFASRHLARRWPEIELPKRLRGSGAQERNIGTVAGHRMKWRGMGWSRKGAANLIRVRLEFLCFQN